MTYKTATGVILTDSLIGGLIRRIHEHERANELQLSDPADIEHQICLDAIESGLEKACSDINAPVPVSVPHETVRTRAARLVDRISERLFGISFHQAVNGLSTIKEWLKTGFATQQEADARAATCVACSMNVDVSCATCQIGGLIGRIANVVGKHKTAFDNQLKHCAECKCANRAKVWVPIDVVLRHTSAESLAKLDSNCWILKGANNLK